MPVAKAAGRLPDFRAIQVPARVVIPGPIRFTIKRLRPGTAYRLMGVTPGATAGSQEAFRETI